MTAIEEAIVKLKDIAWHTQDGALRSDINAVIDKLEAPAPTEKIKELERIIVEAKECVKITQELNDQLQAKIGKLAEGQEAKAIAGS